LKNRTEERKTEKTQPNRNKREDLGSREKERAKSEKAMGALWVVKHGLIRKTLAD